jgi:hypothetical protein
MSQGNIALVYRAASDTPRPCSSKLDCVECGAVKTEIISLSADIKPTGLAA